jgi:hypothetical protein
LTACCAWRPPKKKPALPTLEKRLEALRAEIDAVISKLVDERTAACPGVPSGVVEYTLIGRAGGCKCEALKLVSRGKPNAV